jgi:hypothetical protein
MAKGGRSSSGNSSTQVSNGGIMGSGIFGNFGTMIYCKAEDDSTYCKFMKVFNVLMVLIFIGVIIYFVYIFFLKKKK